MTKFIFTVTSAVATMLGQAYTENTKTVTESVKVEKVTPVIDSIQTVKKPLKNVWVPNKKQMPS